MVLTKTSSKETEIVSRNFFVLQVGLSRENEVRFLRHFNKANIGVPLIATFNNGLVTKLVSGKTVHPDADMGGPVVTRYVTSLMSINFTQDIICCL